MVVKSSGSTSAYSMDLVKDIKERAKRSYINEKEFQKKVSKFGFKIYHDRNGRIIEHEVAELVKNK